MRPLRLLISFAVVMCTVVCRAQISAPPNAGRDCVVCHVQWSPSLSKPKGIVLLEAPAKDIVAESDTCLGCHDGSVSDSRRNVWLEHGHRTGITPSKAITVPNELPLDQGQISCRTCHTAHSSGFNESLKDSVFLRMKNDRDQMCQSCHSNKTQGPLVGSHSLGPMKAAFPKTLIAAGAHAGPQNDSVLCQSCHVAHGAKAEQLLLMPTDASQLCITCHATMRPAMWDTDPTHNHPQNPPIHKPQQLQAIKDLQTQLGTDNKLVCVSCHKMHGGQDGKALVADTLHDSALCIRCHEEKKPMGGGSHDLRKSAPKELNARGESLSQSGYCGACHTFHSLTRPAFTSAADPQGFCITCHSDAQVAAKHPAKMLHPIEVYKDQLGAGNLLPVANSKLDSRKAVITCVTCHDPHETRHPQFMRSEAEQVCASCHAAMSASLSTPHDLTGNKSVRNALNQSPAEAGRCGFCHSIHQATGPMLMVATNDSIKSIDQTCTQCHKTGGMAGKKPLAKFNHPTGSNVRVASLGGDASIEVPLFTSDLHASSSGSMACSSCHDVHSSAKKSASLLRSATASALCVRCHTDQAGMAKGPHDSTNGKSSFALEPAKSKELCAACHRSHGNDPDSKLWTVAPTSGMSLADGTCVACHANQAFSDKQVADRDGRMLHPQVVSREQSSSTVKSGLPISNSSKTINAVMLCKTCHDPHAAPAMAAMLRIEPNHPAVEVCANCHAEAIQIATSAHNEKETSTFITRQVACAPCHQVHANRGEPRKALWTAPTFATGKNEAEQLCLGCHSKAGGASVVTVFSHPQTSLKDVKNASTQPTGLVGAFGNINQISCYTCHLSHGRDVPASVVTGTAPEGQGSLESFKAMLRPDVDRQVCAACHGAEAMRRFLYFHKDRAIFRKR